jgi:hypothetical protein
MNAESNIDHKFVTTSPVMFSIDANIGGSDPPLASNISGPRQDEDIPINLLPMYV